NFFKGIRSGAVGTVRLFGVMYDSLKMLISGGATISDISGPVGIVQMVGETSNQGLWSYGFLVALICVNLAVINMLPLPALDGGRILIVLVCWITGKAVSPKIEGIIHAVGIVLLLGLAVLVTFSDIRKLVG
ncbi:MAG: site-2 protease family protein, partial [Firmicutes bacterium]|nr:site-2 protease family protein [Bacillota bacterium]